MQTENRFFDDLARVASGAFGAFAGLRTEVETLVRQRFERLLADLDLVRREEFDAVKAMAARARTEQEDMAIRLAALEARVRELEARFAPGSVPGPVPGMPPAASGEPA